MENYAGELNISLLLDNSCTFYMLIEPFCSSNEVLHKCLKITVDNMTTYAGNKDISVLNLPLHSTSYYSIDTINLQHTNKNRGFLPGKGAFVQLSCWYDYPTWLVYVKIYDSNSSLKEN